MEELDTIDFQKLHIVYGMVNDKAPEKILQYLPKTAHYYFARPDIPRGLEAKVLQEAAAKAGLQGNTVSSVNAALNEAKVSSAEGDLIYVGGSIFVVAEVV